MTLIQLCINVMWGWESLAYFAPLNFVGLVFCMSYNVSLSYSEQQQVAANPRIKSKTWSHVLWQSI